MQTGVNSGHPPACLAGRGVFFCGVFIMAAAAGLAALLQADSLWIYFANGPVKVWWCAGLVFLTAGLAIAPWSVPRLPPTVPWLAVPLALVVAWLVLQGFANSADEYAYLFQAGTYEQGRLWQPAPILGQALASDYTWVKDGKWVGQYPPGWPLLLVIGHKLGLPFWAVNGGLAALLVGLMRRLLPEQTMPLAASLLAPFFLFNAASLHSHLAAAVTGCAALCCLEAAQKGKGRWWGVLAGLALGWLGLIRYMSAALMAVPFAAQVMRQRQWVLIMAVAAGALPCVLLLLAYHHAITGNALIPVYYLSGRTADHLYFDAQGMAEGFGISFWRMVELVLWAGPGLVLAWGLVLAGKIRQGQGTASDWVFPLFILVFLFYPFDGANRYGPRYYFEALPFLVLTFRGVALTPFIQRLLALSLAYSVTVLPVLAPYYRQIVSERQDLYQQAAAMTLTNAVVLVQDGPGKIWKMEPDDMARNGLDANGPVLYARADKTTVQELRSAFPDRSIWIYACTPECRIRK